MLDSNSSICSFDLFHVRLLHKPIHARVTLRYIMAHSTQKLEKTRTHAYDLLGLYRKDKHSTLVSDLV